MMPINALYLLMIFLISCKSAPEKQDSTSKLPKLTFKGEWVLPHKLQFQNTTIGGLSGIDYNAGNDEYYLICDDRSAINPARYYTARIQIKDDQIDTVIFTGVTFLKHEDGREYLPDEGRPDPEAIRYWPSKNRWIWSSEGERSIGGTHIQPAINEIDATGRLQGSFALPQAFEMTTQGGTRNNGGFEGLTLSDAGSKLWVMNEEPLLQDGPRAGLQDSSGIVRLAEFDLNTGENTAQYAYEIDPVAFPPFPPSGFRLNGVSDILHLTSDEFLVMERSFSVGRLSSTIKIYHTRTGGATNISPYPSLENKEYQKMKKELVLNMNSLRRFIDNMEGMTFGPTLSNGKKSLILVSDDNFLPLQRTQFLLFEID